MQDGSVILERIKNLRSYYRKANEEIKANEEKKPKDETLANPTNVIDQAPFNLSIPRGIQDRITTIPKDQTVKEEQPGNKFDLSIPTGIKSRMTLDTEEPLIKEVPKGQVIREQDLTPKGNGIGHRPFLDKTPFNIANTTTVSDQPIHAIQTKEIVQIPATLDKNLSFDIADLTPIEKQIMRTGEKSLSDLGKESEDKIINLNKIKSELDKRDPKAEDYNDLVDSYNSVGQELSEIQKKYESTVDLFNQTINRYNFKIQEHDNKIKQQIDTSIKLKKSIENKGQEINPITGVVYDLAIESDQQDRKRNNPYLMTEGEADQFYKENWNIPRIFLATTREFLQNVPVVREIANTLLYNLQPENYQFVVADELRKKEGLDKYASYLNNFTGSLAGLFTVGGRIHEGINTLKAIETLAVKNPKIASNLSSFLAGSTYSAVDDLTKQNGDIKAGTFIANTVANGLIWTAFNNVGTKDWFNVQKAIYPTVIPKGQYLKGFTPKFNAVSNGREVEVGYTKDKDYLARSISNWLVDSGIVTGVSDVTARVTKSVNESERNETSLVNELQKAFTEIDLTQVGLEFVINSIFTGSIPRRYGQYKPPPIDPSDQQIDPKLLPKGKIYPPTGSPPKTTTEADTFNRGNLDEIVSNEMNPNSEQMLSTTQKSRTDVREKPEVFTPENVIPEDAYKKEVERQGLKYEGLGGKNKSLVFFTDPKTQSTLALKTYTDGGEGQFTPERVKATIENSREKFSQGNKDNFIKKVQEEADGDNPPEEKPINVGQLFINQQTGKNKKLREDQQTAQQEIDKRQKAQEEKRLKKIRPVEFGQYHKIEKAVFDAKRNKKLVDESIFKGNPFQHPELQEKYENLYKRVLYQNRKLRESNTLTIENVAQKLFKKPISKLTEAQQKEVLFTFNDLKEQKKETISDLQTIKPETVKPNDKTLSNSLTDTAKQKKGNITKEDLTKEGFTLKRSKNNRNHYEKETPEGLHRIIMRDNGEVIGDSILSTFLVEKSYLAEDETGEGQSLEVNVERNNMKGETRAYTVDKETGIIIANTKLDNLLESGRTIEEALSDTFGDVAGFNEYNQVNKLKSNVKRIKTKTAKDHAAEVKIPKDSQVAEQKIKEEVKPGTDDINAAQNFVRIPITSLKTSLKDFQGRRGEYSKQTYDRIISEAEDGTLNLSSVPPIQVWRDPELNDYVILAGHSRSKAFGDLYSGTIKDPKSGEARPVRLNPKFKTSQFEEISAQIVEAKTKEEAIKIAQESNQGAVQTDIENAKYFQKVRETLKTKPDIEEKAKQLYGSNAQRIIDFSYLLEDGKVWGALKQFAESSETSDKDMLKKIAQYVGRARRFFPDITDSHENELYDWLKDGAISKLNMIDFLDRVERIVLDPEFDSSKPLNIANRVTKGYNQNNIDQQIKEVINNIKELEAERDNRKNPPSASRLNKISEEIGYLNQDLAKLKKELKGAKEADFNQMDMFGSIDEAIKEGAITDDIQEEIIEGTDPAELEKLAEDIERKAEDAENLSDKEIESAISKADELIKDEGDTPQKPIDAQQKQDALDRLRGKGKIKEDESGYGIDRIPIDELKDLVIVGTSIYQDGVKTKGAWKLEFNKLLQTPNWKLDIIYNNVEKIYGQQIANIEEELNDREQANLGQREPDRGVGEQRGERPRLIVVDEQDIPKPKTYVGADSYAGGLDEAQQLGVNLALTNFFDNKNRGFMLGDGTGVGKTRQIIAIADQYKKLTGKPVLIISQSKTILFNNFADSALALEVNLDEFDVGTYNGLAEGKLKDKKYGLVVFDESQNLKNLTATKTQQSLNLDTDHKLFASATPTDKITGTVYFFSEITGRTEEDIASELGYTISWEINPATREPMKRVYLHEGISWDRVVDNIIKFRDKAIRSGAMIRREYPFFGTTKFYNINLDEGFSTAAQEAYWWFEDNIQKAKSLQTKRFLSGQRTTSIARFTESQRFNKMWELIKKDIKDGKKIVVIAETIGQKTEPRLKGTGTEIDTDKWGRPFPYLPFKGFIDQLEENLKAEGIKWAKIYDNTPEAKSFEVRKFQDDKVQIAIATPSSGGAGIDLDDQVGDRPRTVYIASLNFAGDVYEQIIGRFSRRNTKSPATVKIMVSLNSFSDNRKYATLKKKLQVIKRIQSGIDPDVATGFNSDSEMSRVINTNIQEERINYGVDKILKPAPAFFSKMQRVLENKLPDKFNAIQLNDILRSGEIKEAEIKWSGIEDFLKEKIGKGEKITKQEVMDFLKMNELRVIEVAKDGGNEQLLYDSEDDDTIQLPKEHKELEDFIELNNEYMMTGDLDNESEDLKQQREIDIEDKRKWLEHRGYSIDLDDDGFVEKVTFNKTPPGSKPTKFTEWTLPGGENYREILFTLPSRNDNLTEEEYWEFRQIDKKPYYDRTVEEQKKYVDYQNRFTESRKKDSDFKSSHWDEPNVFAHTRVNDRFVNGKKYLHIEEVQSDWALEGRKKGFLKPASKEENLNRIAQKIWGKNYNEITNETDRSMVDAEYKAHGNFVHYNDSQKVPDMPFKTTYHEFVLKNLLRKAAEENYSGITWVTGEITADRYDLSKQVDKIRYEKRGDAYNIYANKGDEIVITKYDQTPKQLEELVGKDVAQKIIEDKGKDIGRGEKQLSGVDLKVGGTWATNLYDKVIPNFLTKYGKKWNAKVGEIRIPTGETQLGGVYVEEIKPNQWAHVDSNREPISEVRYNSFDEAMKNRDKFDKTITVHSLPITPEMKKSVLYEGQPLFDTPTLFGREGVDELTKLKDYKKHLELSKSELEKIEAKGQEAVDRYKEQYKKTPLETIADINQELKSVNKKIANIQAKDKQTELFTPSSQLDDNQLTLFEAIEFYGQPSNEIESALLKAYNSFDNNLPTREEILPPANSGGTVWTRRTLNEEKKRALDYFSRDIPYASKQTEKYKEALAFLKRKLDIAAKKREKDSNFLIEYQDNNKEEKSNADITTVFGSEKDRQETIDKVAENLSKSIGTVREKTSESISPNRESRFVRYVTGYGSDIRLPQRTVPDIIARSKIKEINYAGTKIQSVHDIADLSYVFRHPGVESTHLFGVNDNNEIVGNIAHSSGASNFVNFNMDIADEATRILESKGATKIILLHNHPSGNPKPSNNDIETHRVLADFLSKNHKSKLEMSMVINGDKYSYITIDSGEASVSYSSYKQPAEHPNQKWYEEFDKADKIELSDPFLVPSIMASIKRGDNEIAVVVVDTKNIVRGYEVVPASLVKDKVSFNKYVNETLTSHGGHSIFLAGELKDFSIDLQKARFHPKSSILYISDKLNNLFSDVSSSPYLATIAYENDKAYQVIEYTAKDTSGAANRLWDEPQGYGEEERNKILRGIYSNNNFQNSPKVKSATKSDSFGSQSTSKSINDMLKNRNAKGNADGFIISERAKQILKEFEVPINEKHLSRKYLGIYKHITEGIRVQRLYDVVTVVHEVTHALDFKHKISDRLIAMTSRGDALRKQLTDIYEDLYPKGQRTHPLNKRMVEGLATFVENYFYDPTGTSQKYPLLVDTFIKPTGQFYNQDITKLLGKMNNLVDDYAKLEPWQRIASRIRDGKEVVKSSDTGFDLSQRIKFEIFNIFEPLERYAKITGVRRTWEDPAVSAFNYLNRATIAYNWIKGNASPVLKRDGNWDFRKETTEQYFKMIEGKEKEFDAYLVARRDIELYNKAQLLRQTNDQLFKDLEIAINNNDLNSLKTLLADPIVMDVQRMESIIRNDDFSIQDMQAIVYMFEPKFKEPVKIFDAINRNLVDFAENTGLINSETADKWRNESGYASFQRFINDELLETFNTPSSNAQKNLKAKRERTGGKLDIISPTYNQILAISETIGKGLHNTMWVKVYNLSKKDPAIARRFEPIETIVAIENGRFIYPQEKDPNLLRILIDGKRIFIRPAPEFAMLNEALKPGELDTFDYLLRIPSQVFTRLTTSANPLFALSNLPIDQVTTGYNTHHGTIPIYSPIKNAGALAKHFHDWLLKVKSAKNIPAEGLEEYLLLGGKRQTFASQYDLAPEDLKKVITRDQTLKDRAIDIIDSTIGFFEVPSNFSEYASRFAEYKNALEEGKSMSEAMYAAAQVTLPFQQHGRFGGKTGRAVVKSVPYFNPAMVAIYRYGKAWKDNPIRSATISAGLITMALSAAIAMMMSGDDEDKRVLGNLSGEELARAMYIPNPVGKGIIRIRIPEQIGALTGLAYLYVIQHYNGNEATFQDYMKVLTSAIPRQFNVTQPEEMVFGWTPQVLKPSLETMTNTKTFPDLLPIEPDWMKSQYAPEDRYNNYTSYIAKKFGQWAGMSPIKIDYFIKSQFGVVGNFLMGTGDMVQGDFKRFMTSNPAFRNENVYALMGRAYNHFYDKKEFYNQQYNKLKGEHNLSNEEADRIKNAKKTYDKFAEQLTDARALDQSNPLDENIKSKFWEGLLSLEHNDIDKAKSIIKDLDIIIPDKVKRKAKYESGEEMPTTKKSVKRRY